MTKLIKGVCTQCGAPVEFDADDQNAKCPYCDTKFVVDRNITNVTVDNSTNNIINKSTTVNILSRPKRKSRMQSMLEYSDKVNAAEYEKQKAELEFLSTLSPEERKEYLDRKDAEKKRNLLFCFLFALACIIVMIIIN